MPLPLHQQVVVITGASSGIGREAALRFGKAGASVVLAARNQTALEEVANQVWLNGGQAHVVVTDVADWVQVEHLAREAVNTFGRIDTWINDAGVSIYGLVEETQVEEMERLLQVNLMGVIYGCKAALPHMIRQGGGTIINLSSVVGQRAVPLQAAYSASKYGVRGFSEGLRLEMRHAHPDIHVVTVFPAGINTPFFEHARSKMGVLPMPLPPAYPVEVAAETLLEAAQNPKRDMYVGGASLMFTLLQRISHMLADKVLMTGDMAFELQKTDQPDDGRDSLFAPFNDQGRTTGQFHNITKPSMYTELFELHPERIPVLMLPFILGLAFLLMREWRD